MAAAADAQLADKKAMTLDAAKKIAAAFKRPTKVFDDLAKTRTSIVSIGADAMLLEGGIPIMDGGQLVGAVGVWEVTSPQNVQTAQAGITALGN